MVSLTSDKCESSLTKKKMKIPSKQKLTLPNPNQRQDWESVIENVVKSVGNNEELKNSLQKIGKAEKIPRKWNRIDRSTFLVCIFQFFKCSYKNYIYLDISEQHQWISSKPQHRWYV
jgi:hypothetical protein